MHAYRETAGQGFPRLSFCPEHLEAGICPSHNTCVDCGLVGAPESDPQSESRPITDPTEPLVELTPGHSSQIHVPSTFSMAAGCNLPLLCVHLGYGWEPHRTGQTCCQQSEKIRNRGRTQFAAVHRAICRRKLFSHVLSIITIIK